MGDSEEERRTEEWHRVRARLRFGQRFQGTVVWVPKPGVIGFAVEIGLPTYGFVDVLLLPIDVQRWPEVGTVAEFEVWDLCDWHVRLLPVDPGLLREDFDSCLRRWRPGWADERGRLVLGNTA